MMQLREFGKQSFETFKAQYHKLYQNVPLPHPVWQPTADEIQKTNLYKTMKQKGFMQYLPFHQWSRENAHDFLELTLKQLDIQFKVPPKILFKNATDAENIQWLPEAKFNIVDSCFNQPKSKIAITFQNSEQAIEKVSYGELEKRVNKIANGISNSFNAGDALAINMPMNIEAVCIYLAIIKAGCVAVSIADSFAPAEIQTRLEISHAKAIFTQDFYLRNQKKVFIYQKVCEASKVKAIVHCQSPTDLTRTQDITLSKFMENTNENFEAVSRTADDFCNILFSSGTTGSPKAIPWTHTTPIRAAMDGFYHQDIQKDDIVAWPTNLGWMMGPWLVFATFINGATMALCNDSPTQKSFGEFIQNERITILGLVPSIVTAWEASKLMEDYDWSNIKCFSSSGECSSAEDYLYLMWLGNVKPVIEYCGGTEIGGAYLSSTLIQANTPSMFTTPTLGMNFVLLDDNHKINLKKGEVALIPPALGLSQTLMNRDHHEVYFAGMPKLKNIPLRRHGDEIEKINAECYQSLGRADDTMNLGGIKTSSAEIERVLNDLEQIQECAAIAVSPEKGGPSLLVIYAITQAPDLENLKGICQRQIKDKLNPLFKIHDLRFTDKLPRTASNKIMRRVLRDEYCG